jgi:xylulokinase
LLSWSDTILECAIVDKKLLSSPVPSGTKAGPVKSDLTAELWLRPDTLIVNCCHDQVVAAAVGAGMFESGMAIDGAGTVEFITPLFNELPTSPLIQTGKLCGRAICAGREI